MTLDFANDDEKQLSRCVVRLRTTTWADSRGLHTKRSLTYLRRGCVGFNGLESDAKDIGPEQALGSVTNFNECQDGVYEAVPCNVGRDWEHSSDDWEYRLTPFVKGRTNERKTQQ